MLARRFAAIIAVLASVTAVETLAASKQHHRDRVMRRAPIVRTVQKARGLADRKLRASGVPAVSASPSVLATPASPPPAAVASAPVAASTITAQSIAPASLEPACLLLAGKSDSSPDAACLACHPADTAGNHRSGFSYEDGRARLRPGSLRPLEDVVARGLFLPEGEVRCATCHDWRSQWKYRLALPPAARPDHAVRIGAADVVTVRPRPEPGDAVTPTPLCRACHTLAD